MPSEIDILLRQVPDHSDAVLTALQTRHAALAGAQDSNGYSLVHAAASYNKLDLLRELVNTYKVPVDIKDEESETPLFAAETVTAARCLVEELGADITVRNDEGATAEDNALANMDDGDGGEWGAVADYLERTRLARNQAGGAAEETASGGHAMDPSSGDIGDATLSPTTDVHPPPPLPPNMRINFGTMPEAALEGDGAPDPEFRRRIEELASRDDFETAEGQAELRKLVTEALGDMVDGNAAGSASKRRRD